MYIKLYWKSIKNEIDAETWKSARCYITEEKSEERAEAQTGIDNLDVNYCYRKIEEGISSINDICHKYMVGFSRNKERSFNYNTNTVKVGDIIGYEADDYSFVYACVSSIEGTTIKYNKYLSADTEIIDYDKIVNYFIKNEPKPKDTTANNSAGLVSSSKDIEILYSLDYHDKLHNNVDFWELDFGTFGERQNVDGNLLTNLLHKYVVLNVLQEWSKLTNPQITKEYMDRMIAESISIKRTIYRKEEPDWNE